MFVVSRTFVVNETNKSRYYHAFCMTHDQDSLVSGNCRSAATYTLGISQHIQFKNYF